MLCRSYKQEIVKLQASKIQPQKSTKQNSKQVSSFYFSTDDIKPGQEFIHFN